MERNYPQPDETKTANGTAERQAAREVLRCLPAVERLAAAVSAPRHLAVTAARLEIAAARTGILAGLRGAPDMEDLIAAAESRAAALATGSLRPVLNASGVIVHTNLGRAPLAPEAAAAAAIAGSTYTNLELEIESGGRGSRHDHVAGPLRQLTGAPAAIAVNNNAAAVTLALAALASPGEVVIGRDQLVEIGGSFRVPEIVSSSGVQLIEVGTTNRTRVEDYASAIGAGTTALMRVHRSNFATIGFTQTPGLTELAELAAERGLPLIDDLGSGAVAPIGEEPVIADTVAAGALACFSADKLLGGPQAGVIAGPAELVDRCRTHPLARAFRLDKMQLAALEATLRLRRDRGPAAIPATAMLEADPIALERRAATMAERIGDAATVTTGAGMMGGGALPTLELRGPICRVDPGTLGPDELGRRLRTGDPPVIARIRDGCVILDPRTLGDEEAETAADATRRALG